MWRNRPKTQPKSDATIGEVYFGKTKSVFSKSGIVWLTLPRNDLFVSEDGFHGCLRQSHHRTVPRLQTTKTASSPLRVACRLLFPVLEQILHSRIQSGLHAFLHHLKHELLNLRFLFLFTLLFVFFSLAHFITFTVLLKLMVGMMVSLSVSSLALYAAASRSWYSRNIFFRVA